MAKLGIMPTRGDLMEENEHFLANIYEKSNVFLLYDSADDLDIVARVLPRDTARVHVLIATRCGSDHELFSRAHHVTRLGYLPTKDAVSALCALSQRAQPLTAAELHCAERLASGPPIEGLPLAVAHAAIFIKMTGMSFQVYLDLLMRKEEELRAAALDMDNLLRYFHVTHLQDPLARVNVTKPAHLQLLAEEIIQSMKIAMNDKHLIIRAKVLMSQSKHTHLTWQLDIDSVAMSSPRGMILLEFCSLMAARNIPGHVLQSVTFPEGGILAASEFSLALLELSTHSLISAVDSNEQYNLDVHTLVQETVFDRLMKDPRSLFEKLQLISRCLLSMIPTDAREIHSLNQSGLVMLTPHVYSVAEKILMTGCLDDSCWQLVEAACAIAHLSRHNSTFYRLCHKYLEVVVGESCRHDATSVVAIETKFRGVFLRVYLTFCVNL